MGLGTLPATGAPPPAIRWTAGTPDEMAGLALERARGDAPTALAALVVASALDERATFGVVRTGLAAIAASSAPIADEAAWLRRRLEPEPAPRPWSGLGPAAFDAPPDRSGLVRTFAILGPFEDAGGGLTRREGPEGPGERWGDMDARYDWGAFDVAWRRTLVASSTARGLPLDLYVEPRTESCTYLASRLTIPQSVSSLLVHVAATGSVRLVWDGADVATSEDLHRELVLDRLAVRLATPPGDHLLALKLCSGSLADAGRVRVRLTDERRAPVAIVTSSDLSGLELPDASTRAASATRVPTALERALEVGEAPPLDRALAGAILRTLGGADDARSPRAPGLLDRVVNDAAVAPDMLAMAGWISTFGANRSGWLQLALDRARQSGDSETGAFAQRRLAASRLGARLGEWALATASEEPLGSATDPEAHLIRALALRSLGGSGLARATLEDLAALEASLGETAPLAVSSEVFAEADDSPEVRARAAQRLLARAPEARSSSTLVLFLGRDDAASLEAAILGALEQQTSAGELEHLGRALFDVGRYATARSVLELAAYAGPNRGSALRGLAAATAAAAGDGSEQLARLLLERSRELEPGDAALKAELAYRSGARDDDTAAGEHRSAMSDDAWLVAPEVFLERGRATPARPGEDFDRQLHWVRVVTYHADKRVSQLMHYAREIVVEPRTENDLYENVPTEGPTTELVVARLHRKDGTVVPPAEQAASGGRPYVRWPSLHTGDVVEVAVRSWTAGPVGRRGDAPFFFIDYVGSTDTHPVLYNEVVVDAPADAPLAIDVLHGTAERVIEVPMPGRQVTRYVWEHPPTVPEEPLAPQLSEVLPVVVGSTFAGWGPFRDWYRAAVAGFTEPDEQVRRIAAELTRGKRTRDEKLRALFDFVADDIRYVNYVSGEWWLPNRPQELLARRQGDCDDKAVLLITLLRAVGIEATEVLVQTRYTGQPSLLRSEKVAIPLFDHGIAYLPGEGGKPGVWLDATSPESRLGPLPSMDARTLALFADVGPPVMTETPSSSPAEHGVDASSTVALEPNGDARVGALERHSGDAAFELRTTLREPDARAQWLEQYLAGSGLPGVRLADDACVHEPPRPGERCAGAAPIAFEPELADGAASLQYTVVSEGYARREGDELAVPVSGGFTLTSELAPLVKRTLPVVLPPRLAPGHESRNVTLEAPAGYAFAELPPGGDEDGGDFGTAHLTIRAGTPAGEVVVERRLVFDLSTIPVARYEAWRSWLRRVDRLMNRTVRLVPTGDSAEGPHR